MAVKIEEVAPDDGRMAAFEAVRVRCGASGRSSRCNRGCGAWWPVGAMSRSRAAAFKWSRGCRERPAGPAWSGITRRRRGHGSRALLHAQRQLAAADVERVLGPMNGSTWARYRLALPSVPGICCLTAGVHDGAANPFDYPEQFAAAGFSIGARYEVVST